MEGETAQDLVKQLVDAGMGPQEIAEALDNRVSSRTIYRWWKGESEPQQSSDLDALSALTKRSSPTPTKEST